MNGTFLLLAGGLADTLGRKRLFIAGTALFVVLSMAISFARTSLSFTVLMAVLGLAPAILAPAGTGILGAVFPTGRMKTIAFAALGAGQPIGFITGLIFGGILAPNWCAISTSPRGQLEHEPTPMRQVRTLLASGGPIHDSRHRSHNRITARHPTLSDASSPTTSNF